MRGPAASTSYRPARSCDRSLNATPSTWICWINSSRRRCGRNVATNPSPPTLCPNHGGPMSAQRHIDWRGKMAANTLDPTPRLRQEEPQVIDHSDFVDPDDDEDCRAGLLDLERPYDDEDDE